MVEYRPDAPPLVLNSMCPYAALVAGTVLMTRSLTIASGAKLPVPAARPTAAFWVPANPSRYPTPVLGVVGPSTMAPLPFVVVYTCSVCEGVLVPMPTFCA